MLHSKRLVIGGCSIVQRLNSGVWCIHKVAWEQTVKMIHRVRAMNMDKVLNGNCWTFGLDTESNNLLKHNVNMENVTLCHMPYSWQIAVTYCSIKFINLCERMHEITYTISHTNCVKVKNHKSCPRPQSDYGPLRSTPHVSYFMYT